MKKSLIRFVKKKEDLTMRNFILLVLLLFSNCVRVGDRKFLHFFPIFFDNEEISIQYPKGSYNLNFGEKVEIKPTLKGKVSSCSSSENLPLGLSLSPQCVIYGTPQEIVNKKIFTISARHFFRSNDTTIQLTVSQPVSISYPNSPYVLGIGASYTISPNVTGTVQSCEISPSLPTGLTLQNDCTISGIPTAITALTTYTVTATNLGNSATAQLQIEVKNLPTVSFSSPSGSGLESIGTVNIPVNLSFTENATIHYTVSGTATENSDFTISGSLNFTNGGPTTQNLTLNVTDDLLYENDETVVINLNIVSDAIAGTHMTYTYTIQNNDPMPQVSFNISTGSIVENGITANVQVNLSTVSGLDVTVPINIHTSSTATSGSDYTTSSSITIPAGSTTANLVVNITDDSTDENDETVVLNLGTPTNATLGAITTHTLTILDNDPPPTVEFASASSSGLESVTSVNFTVVLSQASEKTVTVNYATSNGTATAGMDYTATSGTLTFSPGVTSQTITVSVFNGPMYEPDETFHITLSSPTNAGLGTNGTHTYTILNEDPPPTVQFSVASQSVNENVGSVTVTISQSAVSGFNTTVNFSIHASSTATGGGTDYSFTPSSPVTISAGSTSANITFNINNDTLYENDETVVINITSATNADLGTTTTHTLTILNDDPMPQVSFTSGTSVSFSEAVGAYGLGFSLNTASGLPVQVTINTADGTATAGSDYTAVTSQVVTIPAGVTSFTYPISITNDLLTEGNETFTITMSSPVNATIMGGSTQTATILDNEIAITSATTLDCNANGKIDHYRLQFASNLTDSSFPGYISNSLGNATGDWLVAGYSNVRLHHGTSFNCGSLLDDPNDNTIYLQFDEGISYDTGAKPDLTTSSNPLATGPAGTVGIISTATITEADGAKPIVISISPSNGASGVLPNSFIQVVFSEDMNTATFNTSNFIVTGSAAVTGTVSTINSQTPRFTPSTSLEYNQSHTVSISNMQDLAGNTNVSFTSGFTTAPKNRIIGNITGLGSLTMTLGVSVNGGSVTSIPTTISNYATGYILANGDTYDLTILSQPEGKVCAILSDTVPAAGTFTGYSDLSIHVNCKDGYLVGNRVQTFAPEPLDFHLYQGNYTASVGDGTAGYVDGASPRFNTNQGIVFDGTYFYIADANNRRIRRMDASGNVSTIAGSGVIGNSDNVIGTNATFNFPQGLATDGTYLYITDSGNHNIRRIRLSGTYEVTTIAGSGTSGNADGIGTAATFDSPRGIALDNNFLYVADYNNQKIRKIKLSSKQVSTLATLSNKPRDLTILGNDIYVTLMDYKIYKVDKVSGTISSFAGVDSVSGSHDGKTPNFESPFGIITDGMNLYVFQTTGNRIRKIRISDKYTSTTAGNDNTTDTLGVGINASFSNGNYLTTDGRNIYASVTHRIAKVINNGLVAYFPLRKSLEDYASDRTIGFSTFPSYTMTSRYGIPNEALEFNGSNYLFLSDLSGLPNGANARTLCAWVNPDDVSTVGEKPILYYGSSGSLNHTGLALYSNGTYFTRIILDLGLGSSNPTANITIPANKWFHVCASYTGSTAGNGVIIYFNGKFLFGTITSPWTTSITQFRIGVDLTTSKYFIGSISDVRVYSRVLNSSEVAEIASQAIPGEVGISYSREAIGLLSRYSFIDGSLSDAGPLERTLNSVGGVTTTIGTNGLSNRAYYFDGFDDVLYVNLALGLPNGNAPRTLCAWVNIDKQPTSGGVFTIISYGETASNPYGSELIYFEDAGNYNLALSKQSTNAGQYRKAIYKLPLYTWTHVCGRYDGSVVRIYVNGRYVNTDNTSLTFQTQATGSNNFAIGSRNDVLTGYFSGKIDEVQIFNHALDEEAIRNMASQNPRGLVARYDFNGDTKDASGFGNDLSPSGSPTLVTDRLGNAASAYSFNGTSDYFFFSTTPLPYSSNSDPNTLCAWARANNTSGDKFAVSYGTGSQQVYVGGKDFHTNNSIMKGGRDLDNWNAPGLFPRYTWNHICSVFNGGTATLYLNGRQVMTGATGAWNISPTVLNIGRSTSGNRYFDGQIDEVLIYNRVLSAEEIRALSGYHYMQVSSWSPTVASSTLKAAYRAERESHLSNGASVITLEDLSGNNHDITNTGTVNYYTSEFSHMPGLAFNSGNLKNNSVSFDTSNHTIFSLQKLASSDPTQRVILSLYKLLVEVQIRTSGSPNYQIRFCDTLCGATTPNNVPGHGFIVTKQRTTTNTFSYTNGAYLDTAGSLSPLTAPVTLTIGANNSSANNFEGRIGELFIFNGQLDTASPYTGFTDRELMECFLAQKNQIVLNHSCP